jgi:hypothetical protein
VGPAIAGHKIKQQVQKNTHERVFAGVRDEGILRPGFSTVNLIVSLERNKQTTIPVLTVRAGPSPAFY